MNARGMDDSTVRPRTASPASTWPVRPPSRRAVPVARAPHGSPWTPYASPSTSARCTATAPASASPSPSCATALDRRADVDARAVRAELPRRAQPPACAACRCPAAVAHRLWSHASTTRASTAGSARRRRRPRHELRRPADAPAGARVGVRLLVPAPPRRRPPPTCAAPARCCAARVARRRRRPRLQSQATADAVRELLGADRGRGRPPRPARRCQPHRSTRSPVADGSTAGPFVLALGTSSGARTCPRSSPRSAARRPRTPDAALVIAGADGDDTRRRVDAAIDALAAASRPRGCCCPGPSTTRPRPGCCATPAVLAYPSLDEGFGFPLLEAQAVGLPVVASDAGSIPEVAGDGAELVALGDVDALAAAPRPRRSTTTTAGATLVAAGRAQRRPVLVAATADAHGRRCTGGLAGADGTDDRSTDRSPSLVAAASARPASCAGCGRRRRRSGSPAIVNTGDDTVLHGLSISPDLDTITYTLAGAIDPERGLGPAPARRGRRWRPSPATTRCARRARRRRRRGSTSATATWPPTSTARPGWPRAPRSTDGRRRDRAGVGPRRRGCCR